MHPKHVGELAEERFLHLKTMLDFPSVVGLGEIGLDRSATARTGDSEWVSVHANNGRTQSVLCI